MNSEKLPISQVFLTPENARAWEIRNKLELYETRKNNLIKDLNECLVNNKSLKLIGFQIEIFEKEGFLKELENLGWHVQTSIKRREGKIESIKLKFSEKQNNNQSKLCKCNRSTCNHCSNQV